jgi:putative endopeptidase
MIQRVGLYLLLAFPALAQSRVNVVTPGTGSGIGPCQNFYQYACANWMASNPIPKEDASWGRFNEIRERNIATLHYILEAARGANPNRSAVNREIGDYYESCMDTATIERRGTSGLDAGMASIAAVDSSKSLLAAIVGLHKKGINAFWAFSSQPDFEDSKMTLAGLAQAGLSLPGRSYYFRQDERSAMLRDKLKQHITAMFTLLGDSPERASAQAGVILKLETQIAQNALERQDQIDPKKTNHKLTVERLAALMPHFDWRGYFKAMQSPAFRNLNVQSPEYLQGVDAVLANSSLEALKAYLRWRLLNKSAGALSARFVDLDFAFYGKTLSGVEALKPRWWRCAMFTDAQLGEALGQEFAARTFGAAGKDKIVALVHELEVSLEEDIREVPWMSDATRSQAIVKLKKLTRKIAYPDRWIDYSSVKISRDDFLANVQHLNAFLVTRDLAKIGKPVDAGEWDMTPPTVNAYYDPPTNSINFPAGILQPPLFSITADDAQNLGGIGVIVGHELTHGYDNNGRRFDAGGNLRDWWTAADDKAFQDRAQCFIDEYGEFDFAADLKGNGQLTLGENIADNGGIRIAYRTLQRLLARTPGAADRRDANGLTPEQRFFMAFGQSWCQNLREETARNLTLTDEHSPAQWRVNGTVQNMPEFQQAFGCSTGQAMVRAPACRVW